MSTFYSPHAKDAFVTGEQIKNMRKHLGLSQEAFGKRLGGVVCHD